MDMDLAATIIGYMVWPILIMTLTIPVYVVHGWSQKRLKQKDDQIRRVLGPNTQIKRGFPIAPELERIVQGALAKPFQTYRYIVSDEDWLFAQITQRNFVVLTSGEERSGIALSMFAMTLDNITPEIAIRHSGGFKFIVRTLQSKIDKGDLAPCESLFEELQRLYSDPQIKLDVLSILSPEVLEALQNPPYQADIYLKRNQLYYLFSSNDSADIAVPELRSHARLVKRELDDNLSRWGSAPSNQSLLKSIKDQPLAHTLVERWRADSL